MNKTVAIVGGSVGVLLIAGVIIYLMQGDTPREDEYSTFGFTNEAVNRPTGTSDEFTYGEDDVAGYDSDISEISYQDDGGGADGDGTLYERSIAGQFPAVERSEEDSSNVALKSTPRSAGTSSDAKTRTTTTGIPTEAPQAFTLSIVSPKAGDVIVNDDGCPEDAELGDEEEATPCIPEPIGRVFWDYGDPTAKMTLELFNESGTRVRTFATKTGNSGRYTWEYSPTMPNGDYKIVATAYDTDGDVLTTAETGLFEVTKSGDPVIGTPSNPGDGSTPTGPAGAVMCEGMNSSTRTPGPGPGPCGSYEIPVSSGEGCSDGMTGENAIVRAWQYNLEDGLRLRKGNSIRFSLERDHAMVFRFKTDPIGSYPTMPYPLQFAYDEHTANGPTAIPFITLSEKKCDFDYSKLLTQSLSSSGSVVPDPITESKNNCFQAQAFSGALLARVTETGSGALSGNITTNVPYCQLKPNTYYYLNVRFEQANNNPRSAQPSRGIISCPKGLNSKNVCGIVIGAN